MLPQHSLPDLFSYEWKGKIEEDSEVLMVRNVSYLTKT